MLGTERGNLYGAPGMGKTVLCYAAEDALGMLGQRNGPALVLGPLRVARDVWTREVEKWEFLSDVRVSAITGTPDERHAALKRGADVFTVNYEQLPWLVNW